jgi:hypothetical protein
MGTASSVFSRRSLACGARLWWNRGPKDKKRLAEVQAAQPALSDAEAYSRIFTRDPDLYEDDRRVVSITSARAYVRRPYGVGAGSSLIRSGLAYPPVWPPGSRRVDDIQGASPRRVASERPGRGSASGARAGRGTPLNRGHLSHALTSHARPATGATRADKPPGRLVVPRSRPPSGA